MKNRNNILYPVLLVILLILCSIQGNRLNALQESERFYRWIISVSSLSRLGDTLEPDTSVANESMDDEIFAQLDTLAEGYLKDYPVDPKEDINTKTGEPHSRLLRAVRSGDDEMIWTLAQSSEFSDIKQEFIKYSSENRIQSSGVGFAISSMYGDNAQAREGANVKGFGLTSMFFGMRTLAANFLWLKVDTFWHAGEVHRMIPLMYTCVTLDPNFIDAYLLGAWHLAYNVPAKIPDTPEIQKVWNEKYQMRVGDKELFFFRATEFLKDGIRKNPRDYRLYFDLGYAIYEMKLDDHVNAIRYLDEARRHKHDRWVPRMLFRSLMLNGQYEDAIEGWKEYAILFPDNPVKPLHFIDVNTAYLHDAIADEALECKQLALDAQKQFQQEADAVRETNPSEAQRLDAEAKKAGAFAAKMTERANQEYAAGMALWTSMYEKYPDDANAFGRISRSKAFEMYKEERYLEAIAELDIARWQNLQFFEEASDIIIQYKEKGDIPFTLSEQMELLRREDVKKLGLEDRTTSKKIQRIECIYRDQQES
jgi:tetratricopeptide (TPR) repeat protein